MSDATPEVSEDANWEDGFTGDFFEDAGVKVENISDDPFGFGKGYHIIAIKEWRIPKVSPTGKFGSYMYFEILEDRYQNVRPFGSWIQIPTPKAVQESHGVPFDPENDPDAMAAAGNFKRLLWATGHNVDALNKARPSNTIGKPFLAKLWAKLNDETGYWEISFGKNSVKRMPEEGTEEYDSVMALAAGGSPTGANEFAGGKKMSAEEAMLAEMANATGE